MNLADALPTTFAAAWHKAEARKAAAEEAERARAEAMADQRIYDPLASPEDEPHDLAMYAGTGIGALYEVPGSEHLLALGDWTIGKEPK